VQQNRIPTGNLVASATHDTDVDTDDDVVEVHESKQDRRGRTIRIPERSPVSAVSRSSVRLSDAPPRIIEGDGRSWQEQDENTVLVRRFPCPVCPLGFPTEIPTRRGFYTHLNLRHVGRVLSPVVLVC
jgi:hypothetical protein